MWFSTIKFPRFLSPPSWPKWTMNMYFFKLVCTNKGRVCCIHMDRCFMKRECFILGRMMQSLDSTSDVAPTLVVICSTRSHTWVIETIFSWNWSGLIVLKCLISVKSKGNWHVMSIWSRKPSKIMADKPELHYSCFGGNHLQTTKTNYSRLVNQEMN